MRMKNLLYVGLLSLVLVGVTACAKPPEQLIAAVSSAKTDAEGAQASIYAGDALNAAVQKQTEADNEIKAQNDKFALFRSYKVAEQKLNDAKAAFEAAKQAAIDGKAKAKAEAEALIAEATTGLTAAGDMLGKAPKGKDTKAEIEAMTNDLNTYKQQLADAQAKFQSEDYLGAKQMADAVKAKAAEISASVQAAIDKKSHKGKK